MAWKRSSVRSRPGPPSFQQLTETATFGLVAFGSKFPELEQEVRQMRQDFEQAAVSITKASSSLADENLKLQDQIAVLEHRPARNQLAIALVEAAGRARELTSSLFDAINKERDLLENKSDFVRSLASGQAMTNDLKDQFAPELDQIAEILSRKQIAIAEFNLKNDAILQHGTESQRHAIQNQLQDLSKGFDQELTITSQAVLRRLAVLQKRIGTNLFLMRPILRMMILYVALNGFLIARPLNH
jgi:hypothetical protein